MDFLQETDGEITRNILDPGLFKPDSFEVIYLGMDIKLIAGLLKDDSYVQWVINPGRRVIQGVKFTKPPWTIEGALDWLRENQKDFKSEPEILKKKFNQAGKSIYGVEVFSAGKWNGDSFTERDLDAMVAAFEETKSHVPPYLKLGHDDDQKLLQADGLPAAGWVEKLYRKGDKLLADFRDIPDKIYQLIEKGAYRKVSIELYQGLEILEKKFSHFISAIALLGSDTPGVMNLNDILARYGLKGYDNKIKGFTDGAESTKIYQYEITKDKKRGGQMPEINQDLIDAKAQLQALQEKLDAANAETAKFKADSETLQSDLAKAKTDLDSTRKEFGETAQKLKEAEIDKQLAELEAAKLVTPAMRPFVKNLLDADKKEYKIEKDKEEKEFSRFDLVKEIVALAKESTVNFDDNSVDQEGDSKSFSVESAEKEIEKFMKENKVDYTSAYKAVMKTFKTKAENQNAEDEQD